MAFASVGSLGTAQNKASSTTLTLTTTADLEVGNVGVLFTAWDNTATTDVESTHITGVTDTSGNTWVKVAEYSDTEAGVAEDGISIAMFVTDCTVQLDSGDTITITCDTARVAKSAIAWEFTKGGGNTIAVEDYAVLGANTGQPAAITLSGMTSQEYLLLHAVGIETNPTNTLTPGASYTGMGSGDGTTGGAGISNAQTRGAYRIATLTTDNPDAALSTGGGHAMILAALYEDAVAFSSVSDDDTGAGSDASSLAATATGTDTGSDTETATVTTPGLPVGSDTGAGADAASIAIAVSAVQQVDGGDDVDSSSLTAIVPATGDTGSGDDDGTAVTSGVTVPPNYAILQGGTNQGKVLRAVTQPPQLYQGEPFSQTFVFVFSAPPIYNLIIQGETNQGYRFQAYTPAPKDVIHQLGSRNFTPPIPSADAYRQGTDEGTSSETAAGPTAAIVASDENTTLEVGSVVDGGEQQPGVSDTGTSSEAGSIEITGQDKSASDTGVGADSCVVVVDIPVTDSAVGNDFLGGRVFLVTEDGLGSEGLGTRSFRVTDSGTSTETERAGLILMHPHPGTGTLTATPSGDSDLILTPLPEVGGE